MQLAAKKGVRYTGGRYEFIVRILEGSLMEPGFGIALENLASEISRKNCSVDELEDMQTSFISSTYSGAAKKYVLREEHNRLASLVFYRTICPKLFTLKIKCVEGLGRRDYNNVDKILEKLLGEFERVPAYGPGEDSIPKASQQRPDE